MIGSVARICEWERWQVRALGLALAWWLALAPGLARLVWSLATSSGLPQVLSWLLCLMHIGLGLGVMMGLAVCTELEATTERTLGRWFLIGFFTLPALASPALASLGLGL